MSGLSLGVKNERADAGRDGGTRVARPTFLGRERGREKKNCCSADHGHEWQPHAVVSQSAKCDDHTIYYILYPIYYVLYTIYYILVAHVE